MVRATNNIQIPATDETEINAIEINAIGDANQSNPDGPRSQSESENQHEIGSTDGINYVELNDSEQTHKNVLSTFDAEIAAMRAALNEKLKNRGRAEIGLAVVDSLNNWLLENQENDTTKRLYQTDTSFGVSMFWAVNENQFVYGQLLPPSIPKPVQPTNNSVSAIPVVSVNGPRRSRTWISKLSHSDGRVYDESTDGFMKTPVSNNVGTIVALTGIAMHDGNGNNLSTVSKKQRLENGGWIVEIKSND
jgi:hypothetical protein